MTRIYEEQPISSPGVWNRWSTGRSRASCFAVTPFNFTAIGGNLTTLARADGQHGRLEAGLDGGATRRYFMMQLLEEAGLPPGVINLVYGPGADDRRPRAREPRPRRHPLHRLDRGLQRHVEDGRRATSSATATTRASSARPAARTSSSRTRPPTSTPLATAIVRGSFEYQGQKCSAASRVYAPSNLWPELRERLAEEVADAQGRRRRRLRELHGRGDRREPFKTQKEAIEEASAHAETDVLVGGGTDDTEGCFVEPTVIETDDPDFRLLRDELFGPVVTAYVYAEKRVRRDARAGRPRRRPTGSPARSSPRTAAPIEPRRSALRYAAGNFYVNDKPTGAVVGQQPFGGARASGTNDKAGSMWNLIRWVSPRTIKETFVPPTDYRYPYMGTADDAG